MQTILYDLKVYNAPSIANVRSEKLRNSLIIFLKGANNVPLTISTTPISFKALPSNREILQRKKTRCFGSLLRKIFVKSTAEKDVLNGNKLIIQAGFHATLNADRLLKDGLSHIYDSNAFEKGKELEGPGLYVAEDESTASNYAKRLGKNGKVLEVWLSLDSDHIDSSQIQKTMAHDIVIRNAAFDKVFFV